MLERKIEINYLKYLILWYTIYEVVFLNEKKFDKKKYDTEYKKSHYLQFKVDIKKEEKEELDLLLLEKKLTKADFLRNAIEELKKK